MAHNTHAETVSQTFDLHSAIEHIAHWLPAQGPIKDFIHHNTLHAVQDHPFHQGVAIAAKVFGARSYLPLADYHQRFKQGRISQQALDWAVARSGETPERQQILRDSLFEPDASSHLPPLSLANHGIRAAWLRHLELDLNALAHPVIFRLLSNFLDQGISIWTLPKPGERFWDCLLRLVNNSFLPLYPFHRPRVKALLQNGPESVILHCLQAIVGDPALYEQYLLEVLLAHPGWSGMVRIVETQPQSLLLRRNISLLELLAVDLACELALVDKKRGKRFLAISQIPDLSRVPRLDQLLHSSHVPTKLKVWHEAMEWSLHIELLAALQTQTPRVPSASPPQVQALFCIDDRECSVRRYLEATSPHYETFGAPGFFGIDFLYQGLEDVFPVAQCPAVITPKHLIVENGTQANDDAENTQRMQLDKVHFGHYSFWRGWFYTQTVGLLYALRLAWSVMRPNGQPLGIKPLSEIESHGHLHMLREHDEPNENGYLVGFSVAEMADKVSNLLRNIGMTQQFAPLVVIVAHGSSSVNNPHFAAYDCGACSGKPGAPNARAFVWMANYPPVKALLRERGIDIPEQTYFVAALHNTSRDEIEYFDLTELPASHKKALHDFQRNMHHALQRNARERCRWFELGPQSHDNAEAHQHVVARATSLFEPRPELNHSNNLYCIVGRRTLSQHLFMDRRAFLQSYDPLNDADGAVLARVLSAVIPVCGGINLEYLFSRIDNSVYGAGTKLPHNVIGLLGVANGVEGDLRTGLPAQMIEVHEPARLLLVVEQSTAVVNQAITAMGVALQEWLDNEWIRLVAFDPLQRDLFLYQTDGWQSLPSLEDFVVPHKECSEQVIVGQTRTIPVHQLIRGV